MNKAEQIADLSDKWWEEWRASSLGTAEGVTAAAHLLYQFLLEAPSRDRALALLNDVYLLLSKRLLQMPAKSDDTDQDRGRCGNL